MTAAREAHDLVIRPTTTQLIHDDRPVPVRARLRWSTDDPYAVQITFKAGRRGWIDWVTTRDLLAEGINVPAGVGDIRIRPDGDKPGFLRMELSSPHGEATILLDAVDVVTFLDETFEIMPAGHEVMPESWLDGLIPGMTAVGGDIDVDRAFDQIMGAADLDLRPPTLSNVILGDGGGGGRLVVHLGGSYILPFPACRERMSTRNWVVTDRPVTCKRCLAKTQVTPPC